MITFSHLGWENSKQMISIRPHVQKILDKDLPRVLSLLILSYLEDKEACIRTWGKYGHDVGEFAYPRGIAVLPSKEVAIADSVNNRVQIFTFEGKFQRMLGKQGGKPGEKPGEFNCSSSVTLLHSSGELAVLDTFNSRVQVFSSEGKFLRMWGKYGEKPGEFCDPNGITSLPSFSGSSEEIIVMDTGNNRIQVFTLEGKFLRMWGKEGEEAGEFGYPRDIGASRFSNEIIVPDELNHRIQVFTPEGQFLRMWGKYGEKPGEFAYSFDVSALPNASHSSYEIAVADTLNHRIQVFTPEGKFLRMWGKQGQGPGEFRSPQGIASLPSGEVIISDTHNHRIQIFGVILD